MSLPFTGNYLKELPIKPVYTSAFSTSDLTCLASVTIAAVPGLPQTTSDFCCLTFIELFAQFSSSVDHFAFHKTFPLSFSESRLFIYMFLSYLPFLFPFVGHPIIPSSEMLVLFKACTKFLLLDIFLDNLIHTHGPYPHVVINFYLYLRFFI